jgi:hypothetical protein
MKDDDLTLETSGIKEPDLKLITKELEQAQADLSTYLGRVDDARQWWQCLWDNQWEDGMVHPDGSGKDCWPWNGASDSRLHIVETIVKEHVTLDLVAFWSAKVQAKSIRPFESGRDVNVAQRMLNWRVYTHMKRELLRELPLAFTWKHALGLAFMGIEWEQQRELVHVPVTTDDITQLATNMGLNDVVSRLFNADKAFDDELIAALQQMSPILMVGEARKILNDLRDLGQADMPIASLRINKPVWTALRPGVDVLIPSETVDIQNARWMCRRELVSRVELEDRVVTDGYASAFVEEAVKHKGVFASWMPAISVNNSAMGSDRDLYELVHFYSRQLHQGVPCMYRTVFNAASIGNNNLYAVHRKFEYDHQQYPVVAFRRTYHFRPMLSSVGIADESYTDERDIKIQQDGLNNRTDLIHSPPMIVPTLRAQATKNAYGPKAVMTATRPNEVNWAPLPPMDETPIYVMQNVQARLDRRYPITGGSVDPEIKAVHRQQLADQCLGEIELCLEMTYQLQQQYETDADVQRVAGGTEPWQFTAKDIQGQYEVTASVDMKSIDLNYKEVQLDALGKIMPFKDAGGKVFNYAAQVLDPDLADALTEDQMSPAAMQREKDNEYSAVGQIMSGVEPIKPMMANNQFRLQTIQEIVQQPQVMQKLANDPIAQKLLQNRVEFFQNQIQQFQQNPQIGRALSTQTFAPTQAPVTSNQPPQ